MTSNQVAVGAPETSIAAAPDAGPTQAVTLVQPSAPAMPIDRVLVTIGGLAAAVLTIATLVALIHKALTKEVKRDVADVKREVADLRHTVKGEKGRTDALEHFRMQDVERIARLEINAENVKEGLARIEAGQQKSFSELAASIREIRTVNPRA